MGRVLSSSGARRVEWKGKKMIDVAFGGPRGGIVQTAYVVPEIQAAMRYWMSSPNCGAPPSAGPAAIRSARSTDMVGH